ncbi:MAG: hypothetical protein IPN08_02550 [Bacteroidales bacterium]|jgi:membrane protease YdiL (CAAX protease family)|nr:hypothetical protein [Bacteroidales bacterium]MBK9356263.1 hypothetical protein [Bacteroidales bacterium]
MDSLINIGIIITYILLAVTVAGAVIFPIVHTLGDLKKAKGGLIGVALFLVVFLISYAVSPVETGPFYEKFEISPNLSKVIGGGLVATYIFTVAVVASIVYSQVSKWIK